jgi:AraC family transcriptional regulator
MLAKSPIIATAPAVDISPADIAERHSASWRGLHVETVHVTHRERFECQFQGNHHLLIAAELGSREDGETAVEGLPISRQREFSGKLTFVPAGHKFNGWQAPRVLARSVFFYIDPNSPILPPEAHFNQMEFKPRLFFADSDLWETAQKLKREAEAPSATLYAEALEAVLAHELVRMNNGSQQTNGLSKGGLAAWQEKRIAAYIEEHLTEDIPLIEFAQIAGLSPYHFSRAFKETFGVPPHRYHLIARIEHAKSLLVSQGISVTEAGLKAGFRETSSFSAAFRKITHQSPSQYRRSLR